MTTSARKPIAARMPIPDRRAHQEVLGRGGMPRREAPKTKDWHLPPHCNTPLRHPAYAHMEAEQKVALWHELASGIRAKGLRERLQERYAQELQPQFDQFEVEAPLALRQKLFAGRISLEASSTEHVFRMANYIPLANFLADLPFTDRLIMLEVAVPILLDLDACPSDLILTRPKDIFLPDHDLHFAQYEFGTAHTHVSQMKAEYERGTQWQKPLTVCLEDLFDVTYNESWDGPEETRQGPKWIITRAPNSVGNEYLEGVLMHHPIRWVSAWDDERLYRVFGHDAHLRRLAFGLYANDSFTIGKVQRWRKNPVSLPDKRVSPK